MNKRLKGRRNELKAKAILEQEGWITYLVKGTTRFNKEVDIFGLFDIIAAKDGKFKFVQVKSNEASRKMRNMLLDWKQDYGNPMTSVELWVFKDRKGLVVEVV